MLQYTGHPFIDIGIATIVAFASKTHPQQLELEDLDAIADYLEECYTQQPMTSFLSVVFPNSGFTQPAYNKLPQKRIQYARKVLRLYRPESLRAKNTRCIFTGQPAAGMPLDLDNKLPPGHSYRQHIPLTTGEGIINYHPNEMNGIPISGQALLALHALPLGCAKVGGRLLAIHASDNDATLYCARHFLHNNMRSIEKAREIGATKLPEPAENVATLLIKQLLAMIKERQKQQEFDAPASITAYYFTNSGQGPDLQIFHIPLEVYDFLSTMLSDDYRQKWEQICERAWEVSSQLSAKQNSEEPPPTYNILYEELLQLPTTAAHFISHYLLRRPFVSKRKGDPRRFYSTINEAELVSWRLTESFLRKVVSMEPARIAEIKNLGDSLAEYIHSENDKRLFNSLLNAQRYDQLRAALIRANVACLRRRQEPLLRLKPYLAVFEEAEGLQYADWRLARDLVIIRVVEQLHEYGWLKAHADDLDLDQGPIEAAR
ncbi:MAG: type I-B CRISPR-associated protein Cas8b1/Cst1 [Firmicutes bacterium]|nr:type I-B CRISPR-associated protein Cas8b1/Cst1 [Bacillota bacterium]